ncbi:hypothetical protein JXQ31_04525 [candidate division KSB1 bacterium]|nr:hypothetical protein [candidate division KSB1 bacterium]
MSKIFFFVYNVLFIPLFFVLVHFAGLFHHKIRRGITGRKGLFEKLEKHIANGSNNNRKIWIHISSLGEFEQAKPVIDEIRSRMPVVQIILSIFSPSAYENIHIQDKNIFVTYIPVDTYWHVKKFIDIIQPDIAITVRHDIWPNFHWYLKKKNITSLLIDASITDKRKTLYQIFRVPIRSVIGTFTRILTVSEESSRRYQMVYPEAERIQVLGDTRYDRVLQRSQNNQKIEFLIKRGYFNRRNTFVAGSTWPSDEKILLPAITEAIDRFPEFTVIIAPHEPTEEHLIQIEGFFDKRNIKSIRYSELDKIFKWSFRILLIDGIGLLANLYSLGELAYVGGGFGPGVHNVLEPAAHGCAVLFGPRNTISIEPQLLLQYGGGKVIEFEKNVDQFLNMMFTNPQSIQAIGEKARDFILSNTGASRKIVDIIENC